MLILWWETFIKQTTYKIRLAVKGKGKGKSGGLRIISHVVELEIQLEENMKEQEITVYLLSIYDKSEMENISDKDLKDLIDTVLDD